MYSLYLGASKLDLAQLDPITGPGELLSRRTLACRETKRTLNNPLRGGKKIEVAMLCRLATLRNNILKENQTHSAPLKPQLNCVITGKLGEWRVDFSTSYCGRTGLSTGVRGGGETVESTTAYDGGRTVTYNGPSVQILAAHRKWLDNLLVAALHRQSVKPSAQPAELHHTPVSGRVLYPSPLAPQ